MNRPPDRATMMRCLMVSALCLAAQPALAQVGSVRSHQKISETYGGLTSSLNPDGGFGLCVAMLGDIDGDGVADLAVGAPFDDDGGPARGAVWILFLLPDGTVKSHQKISSTEGGFDGDLDDADDFGFSVAFVGDLDGDGIGDIAAGALGDDDGAENAGAVWILFLESDGTVREHRKISATSGDFLGTLDVDDHFGASLARLGDHDGDGVADLAVGARLDDDGGWNRGAVWLLFLRNDGAVAWHRKISDTEGGFDGELDDADRFGRSVTRIGDLDGDGVAELAIGASLDDDGGFDRGAVWILFMETDGTIKSHQKISHTEGDLGVYLNDSDEFGVSTAAIGDLDMDGVPDLVVGAWGDDDGPPEGGAVHVLMLDPDGTVKTRQKISAAEGAFLGTLDHGDLFGYAASAWPVFGAGQAVRVAVGAWGDDDGDGSDQGAVWMLTLERPRTCLGDINGDGFIDVQDLLQLLGGWGTCESTR